METLTKTKRSEQHYYKLHITFCPVCLKERTGRERVYGEKPDDPRVYTQVYDYCNE